MSYYKVLKTPELE